MKSRLPLQLINEKGKIKTLKPPKPGAPFSESLRFFRKVLSIGRANAEWAMGEFFDQPDPERLERLTLLYTAELYRHMGAPITDNFPHDELLLGE